MVPASSKLNGNPRPATSWPPARTLFIFRELKTLDLLSEMVVLQEINPSVYYFYELRVSAFLPTRHLFEVRFLVVKLRAVPERLFEKCFHQRWFKRPFGINGINDKQKSR